MITITNGLLTTTFQEKGAELKRLVCGKTEYIWPGAPYICMDPWRGIWDRVGSDQNLKTKEGIRSVEPGQRFVSAHTLEILTPEE